ncbi:hypothetical protein IKD67_01270 [Candidatus Saccharibacteria bacterium]|nr:hypothetical protein [Candidatus Saccharibacteria bacterium]
MKDDRIFAIKVNKDRNTDTEVESAAKDTSTKVVSESKPEAKPKVEPKKAEPKKTKPDGSGDDGYVTEFGTFYSIEEYDSFFKEQVRKWRELQDRQKDDYSELFDKYEENAKRVKTLEESETNLLATVDDRDNTITDLTGKMNAVKKAYAEGVLVKDLVSDAEKISGVVVDEFNAAVKNARDQYDSDVADAHSEYDKVKEAYKTAKKALDAAEKLKEKKLKEADSKYYEKIEAASDEFKGRFAEEFEKKKDERAQEARERVIEREDIAEEKAAIEIAEKFAEENDRSIRKRKEKLAERERRAK